MSGELNVADVEQLRHELWRRLDTPDQHTRQCLAVDLAEVRNCPSGLLTAISEIYVEAQVRGSWLRLVGLGEAILAALDTAPLSEVLMMYLASGRWGAE